MHDPVIKILPEHLANQIAAGEVVQRPESVVKELVENAIDAGATSVTVVVQEGGLRSIHVVDNGVGMAKADLELSVVRHATSKISSEADLHAISTLGFRGEALASIAAVAEVEIATAREHEPHGWTLYSKPGEVPTCKPSASRSGTSIHVLNLFATVPARRKFLKSPLTEFRYITETLQKLAVARPDIRFVLYDGQSVVLDLHAEEPLERIVHVLRNAHASDLIPVEHAEQGIWVKGYVGGPQAARKNRNGQFLFLNGRTIQSKSLAYGIQQCYEHVLAAGQHPSFALWIDIDPERIDVNIHPQKHEVKFDDERAVFLLVQHAVTTALASAMLIPDVGSFVPLAQTPLQSLAGAAPSTVAVNRFTGEILERATGGEVSPQRAAPYMPSSSAERPITGAMHAAYAQLFIDESEEAGPRVLFLDRGIAFCRHEDGIMALRVFAAMERVFYEQMIDRRTQGSVVSEQLLFPVQVELNANEIALIQEHAGFLASFGYDVSVHGTTVTVQGVPWFVQAGQEEGAMADVLECLGMIVTSRVGVQEEQMIVQLARKRAYAARSNVAVQHVQQLVQDLRKCTISHVSPSGMATYTIVTTEEIEKRLQ